MSANPYVPLNNRPSPLSSTLNTQPSYGGQAHQSGPAVYQQQPQPQTYTQGSPSQNPNFQNNWGLPQNQNNYNQPPKSFEGGRVGNYNQGFPANRNDQRQMTDEEFERSISAANKGLSRALPCIVGTDLIFLIVLSLLFTDLALKNWGWWFVAGILYLLILFNILTLIMYGLSKPPAASLFIFNTYCCLRLLMGIFLGIMSLIYLIFAIILWSSDSIGPATLNLSGNVVVPKGWVYFLIFLFFQVTSIWFNCTAIELWALSNLFTMVKYMDDDIHHGRLHS